MRHISGFTLLTLLTYCVGCRYDARSDVRSQSTAAKQAHEGHASDYHGRRFRNGKHGVPGMFWWWRSIRNMKCGVPSTSNVLLVMFACNRYYPAIENWCIMYVPFIDNGDGLGWHLEYNILTAISIYNWTSCHCQNNAYVFCIHFTW